MIEPLPNIRERKFTVDQNFDGWRLDRFLSNRMGRLSRTRAAEIAKLGDLEIDPPRRIKAGTRLRIGDVVTVREHLAPETLQDDEVSILFQDDALVVLNKPPGMLVHEIAQVRLNTIQGYLDRRGIAAELVHRLDRETSGVLVCATKAHVPAMHKLFATDHPEKIYRALVEDPQRTWEIGVRRTITEPLGFDKFSDISVKMGAGDMKSTTHASALGYQDGLTDLEVQIETGRQHQIRVHLLMEGTPIAGDKLYSIDDPFFVDICDKPEDPELLSRLRFPRHALHAWRLRIAHPVTQEIMEFEAPLPRLIWDTENP